VIGSRARLASHRGSHRERAIDFLFLLPILAILAGFLFYPLVYGIVLSLHDTRGFDLTTFVGLDHYAHAILGDAVFHRSLLNTVLFTGAAVLLQTGLGLFLAVLVADARRGRAFFQFVFFAPFVLAPVAVGAVWKFLYAPYFGIAATAGSALGFDTLAVAPLADAGTALWAIMAAFLWRFSGLIMVVYLAAIQALPREYYEYAVLEGADHPRDTADLRHGVGDDRGRSVARHRDGRHRRVLDRVPVPPGRLCTGDGDDPAGPGPAHRDRGIPDPPSPRRDGELVTGLPRLRLSTVLLSVLAAAWLYPLVWTLTNAIKSSADIYRAPWDVPWPPAIGNIGEAWSRGQLGLAMANSAYVTAMTVTVVLVLSVTGAYALTRLRPPGRAVLFLVVLAPLIIPTEVLIVPLFSMFRALGLVNSLPGLALTNVVANVSFATLILTGYFRTIPQDVIDAARVDGAGRVDVLLRIVIPLARPGILAVAVLVAVFTWNDFGGSLVLLQKPDVFTAPLALSRFSTFYATDQGLTFAGMAIVILPPLLLFLVVQRSFIRGLTAGAIRP